MSLYNNAYLNLIPCEDVESVKYFYSNVLEYDYSKYIQDSYLEYKINEMYLVFCDKESLLNKLSNLKNKISDSKKKEIVIHANEEKFLNVIQKLEKYSFINKSISSREDMHSIQLLDPEGNSIILYFSHQKNKSLSKSYFI